MFVTFQNKAVQRADEFLHSVSFSSLENKVLLESEALGSINRTSQFSELLGGKQPTQLKHPILPSP